MQRSMSTLALLILAVAPVWAQTVAVQALTFPGQVEPMSAPQPDVPPEQRCAVGGRVTNALTGEPLRKATVRLTASRTGGGVVAMGAARASSAWRTGLLHLDRQ